MIEVQPRVLNRVTDTTTVDKPCAATSPMRITLVIHSLSCGGAERVLSIMANYWADHQWEVTLITFSGAEQGSFFPLHSKVNWIPLGVARNSSGLISAMYNNADRVLSLRRTIVQSRPDAVISFVAAMNVLTVLACAGRPFPVIISERCDPGAQSIGATWGLLRRLVYPRADAVVVQTRSIKEFFPEKIRVRSHIIPNPVIAPKQLRDPRVRKKRKIIGMGRLVEQKGFDLLLRAFSKISAAHPDWFLEIWGQGPLRQELEQLAQALHLANQVSFPGQTQDTHAVLLEADLFVLSSRYEGFPNVLSEAMACGLPVITFDVASGPRDIVEHESNGLLVEANDIDGLAHAIERLLKNESERVRLAGESSKIVAKYGLSQVMKRWEALLGTCVMQCRE